jgi:hypothetical protein
MSADLVNEIIALRASKTLAEQLLDEQSGLERSSYRQNYDELTEEVIEYARPDLIGVLSAQTGNDTDKGARRGRNSRTSEVYTDIVLAAHGFQTQTASPSLDWFSYRMKHKDLEDDDEVQAWLQAREQTAYQMFQGSNFYSIQTPVWKDGLSLGNAPGMVEEADGLSGIVVKKFHVANTYWLCNALGEYEVVHRKFWLTAAEAWRMFSPSRHLLSTDLLACLRNGDQWHQFQFLQCYRRQDDLVFAGRDYKYHPRAWSNLYIQMHSDKHKDGTTQGILRTGGSADGPVDGHNTCRFFNWRYDYDPEDGGYGRGPGQHGIGTIKRLHGIHGEMMMAGQRAVNGPLISDRMNRGILQLNPGGVTFRDNPNQDIRPIYQRIDYPFGIDMLERQSREVQDLLHVAILRILTQSSKPMTAREATLLYQEKAALIGPAVQSHEHDFLQRCHAIAWEVQAIEDPDYYRSMPDVLKRVFDQGGNTGIEVEFQGMLAQTQRAMIGLRRMEAALGSSEAVLAINPDSRDIVDWDKVFERQLDDSGWWQDTIRTDDEVAQIRRQRLEMHMAAVNAEVQQRLGGAAQSYANANRQLQEAEAAA